MDRADLSFRGEAILALGALADSFELASRERATGTEQGRTILVCLWLEEPVQRHGWSKWCKEDAKSLGLGLLVFNWFAAIEKTCAAPKRKWEMRPEAMARLYWACTAEAHGHSESENCEQDECDWDEFEEDAAGFARPFISKKIKTKEKLKIVYKI